MTTTRQGPLGRAIGRLRNPSARRWYLGSVWGLIYLAIPIALVWNSPSVSSLQATFLTVLLVIIGGVYVIIPPVVWDQGPVYAAVALAIFAALTLLGIPYIGLNVIWLWIYIPIMASMSWQPRVFSIATIVIVVLAQAAVLAMTNEFPDYWYSIALTASIGIMMFGFSMQIRTIIQLRAAQSEIARLAVVDERARFSRDMHDVLGHSLTVVTVKSELAGKLVPVDPDRAVDEIADIERLSRAALADLRAAVAGYREMSLATELSAAQAALIASDIAPHLPTSTEGVAPELRELFAWVLRESITNIIRHSNARNCWVAVERRSITIGDDGRGGIRFDGGDGAVSPSGAADAVSGGLAGLAARAAQSDATLTVAPGDDGGTTVTVRGPKS